MTRTATAKEVAGWLHEVALQLGKRMLAGEANTYAERLVGGGFGAVELEPRGLLGCRTWAT